MMIFNGDNDGSGEQDGAGKPKIMHENNSPAHDFMCKKYTAHLGIFILAFVHNSLEKKTKNKT